VGSRVPVVAMLGAAMIVIVGVAIYAVGGGGNVFASGDGFHKMSYVAPKVAPLEVGGAPRIAIDDPSDRVIVTASNDRFVHVVDRTQVDGMLWGTPRVSPLEVKRTSDGVSITRAANGSFVSFGYQSSTERIEVQVPADSALAVTSCGGAEISGVQGGVTAVSVDGSILLADLRGTVNVRDVDGRIEARRVTGDTFAAHSNDGRIILDGVAAANVDVSTNDGRIIATFPSNTSATVTARTNDGNILRDGSRLNHGDGDAASQNFTLGSGAGKIALATDDGTISIFTNGAN
jgi:hypothetical protein